MDFFNKTLLPRIKLDKESIPKLRFFISQKQFRTSWFTACAFRETVKTFGCIFSKSCNYHITYGEEL